MTGMIERHFCGLISRPMRSLLLLVAVTLSPIALAAPDVSVVLGNATGHYAIHHEIPCPEDTICMDAWIGWRIRVTQTLSGPILKGHLRVARIQHTEFIKSYLRRIHLFVLRPINDAETREALGADYYLEDFSQEHHMYCTGNDPKGYGLANVDVHVRPDEDQPSYCFELPAADDKG
jgi:hypothetical protein